MVRKYVRILGVRKYEDYEEDVIEEALKKITDENISLRQASVRFGIPFGTLYNRYKGLHFRAVGRPTLFTIQEELQLVKSAATCGEWGYPLSKDDIRFLAKNYLDKQGKVIPYLKENKPGIDWVVKLLIRHKPEVCKRVAANIKRARATVGIESLERYCDNLEKTIENFPPSNLFNYDETNMADDPGKKFKIHRRGVKYPEQICNFSKSATTIMICGSASGVLLPPYVIYRSTKMWNTWTENGPKGSPCCEDRCCSSGSRYNRTNHGWMESSTFTDWFMTCFLPHAKKLEGKKVIIGNNLTAHFTDEVLKCCEKNDIAFVCLVPHFTHLTQALDVCFFRPMKMAWRSTLIAWKTSNPKTGGLPKEDFPRLLQQTLTAMDNAGEGGAIKIILISGFAATGVSPYDPTRVLSKISGYFQGNKEADADVSVTLIDLLKEQRFGGCEYLLRETKKELMSFQVKA